MAIDKSLYNKVRYNVLFEGMDEKILEGLYGRMESQSARADEIIFEDSSRGSTLYLLLSGSVQICKKTKTGEIVPLGVLHAGDFFGELELIDDYPRSARTVALTDCQLVVLQKRDFDELLAKNKTFALNLLKMLSLRLRTGNQTFLLEVDRHIDTMCRQLDKMHQLVEATKIVNSTLDVSKLLELILQTATHTVQADRGTVYLLDDAKGELWSKVLQGESMVEIRLPVGKGIAGYVAAAGETINIPDAYADPRFNPEVDRATGYRTKTILCMPMKNKDNKTIGVFQLLNKLTGSFTTEDEEFLAALSIHAAIAIENAQLAQQMIQNERLSAVGRMASTIIHDIKNPMGTLRVYAQVVKKQSGNEEVGKLADEMIRQVDRFVNMAQEILDFSKGVSSTNFEEVEFNDTMEGVLAFIERDLAKRNVKIEKDFHFTGKVKLDQDKMMRVFYNIAGNAADAMPNGGSLVVKTSPADGAVMIEFIDTGTGMPPEIRAKVFEPFVTYGKKHGTGLGMAIVKKIIDDHKGRIEIDSEMGKGTTVRLFIPLVQA